MILKGTANRGVKLLGTEVGAWLVDGINNDFQIIKNLPSHWALDVGTGSIDVAYDTITINKGTTGSQVRTPITTVIGEVYSVSATVISSVTPLTLRVGDTTDFNGERVTLNTAAGDVGLFTVTFTATQTTHYVKLQTVLAPNNETLICKNEVEIRTAEIVTGAELHTYSNAAADPNGTEANATTGFTATNNAVLSSVASPVDTGAYAISIENNTTPTSGGGAHADLNDGTFGLVYGEVYILTISARHNGTGGIYLIGLFPTTVGGSTTVIDNLSSTDTTYADYVLTWTHTTNTRYFACLTNNGAFDGGVYIDNFSIRKALPDLSSVNMGLAIYGSLNKHVVNVNADTVSYSGFSNTDLAKQPYISAVEPNSSDLSVECWIKTPGQAGNGGVVYWGGSTPVDQYYISVAPTGVCSWVIDSGATAQSCGSISTIDDNIWHKLSCTYNATTKVLSFYVDGEFTNSETNGALTAISDPLAFMTIGNNSSPNAPYLGEIASVEVDVGVLLTISQIRTGYNKEKILFERDSVHQVVALGLDLNIERPSAINETPGGIRSSIPSDDGTARESIFQRRQKTHSASSGPVEQKSVKYITNFLDTVNEGQAFSYDPYGTENAPCDPKFVWLESASYQPVRDGDTNWFTTSWTMLERN